MNRNIKEARIVEGPSYAVHLEDGMGTFYDYFIEVEDDKGDVWTHKRSFQWNESELKEAFFSRIQDGFVIDTKNWWKGDVWAAYRTPQTYEEEKADYYDREASPSDYDKYNVGF